MSLPRLLAFTAILIGTSRITAGDELRRLKFHHPQLVVDLGVGLWAWPLPMDYDQDGDLDLVISSPDKPYNGTYFFENKEGKQKHPVFEAPRRISRGLRNVRLSFVEDKPRVLGPGKEYHRFFSKGLDADRPLPFPASFHQPVGDRSNKTRANQWHLCDFDQDGDEDLIIGIGDWSDYGWDDAFDQSGNWTNGPLHGFVYFVPNEGTSDHPKFVRAQQLRTTEGPIDVFGWPSPNLADFDRDGDLDLICGEFLDGFTYFENVGAADKPLFAPGRRITDGKRTIRMDLQMIVPVSIDWDQDGDQDLIVGDEDGRVALVENTGQMHHAAPVFKQPFYFQQKADLVKCGALSTPCGFDWDGDGDDVIISGNTAGYIEFFENLGPSPTSPAQIRWQRPERLAAAGKTIRIQAGAKGSIQGPCEAKWGYTTLSVADWDHDQKPDVIANSIWGKVIWFRNIGTRSKPQLEAARPIHVQWSESPPKPAWNWWSPNGQELVTQWRTTPVVVDWTKDGLNDLVMLDHEGFLCLYERKQGPKQLVLLPPKRLFTDLKGKPMRMNSRSAGGSGRRKLSIVDWDQDGHLDLLLNSKNADLYRQVPALHGESSQRISIQPEGALSDRMISSHTTSPTTIDLNRNGIPDLLVGAEDGHFYYLSR
ncbi:MAG: VCBS repeat-containing protein [Planctomycetaceae bacterium]|nr:VCBS repeat-containing protein [Planctomycetaceae bacterium]